MRGKDPSAQLWPLRLGVSALCFGTAAAVLAEGWPVLTVLSDTGPIAEAMFETLGFSHVAADAFAHVGSWLMLALSVLVFWRRSWPLLPIVTVWTLLHIAGEWMLRERFYWLAPGEHALRLLSPIALMLLVAGRGGAIPVLRVACAATFLTHGMAALWQHPEFVDLILGSFQMSQVRAVLVLQIIGSADIVCGVAVLFVSWRWLLSYLVVWGFVTAASQMIAAGWEGAWARYPDTLVRLLHGFGPLALLLCKRTTPAADTLHDNP